MQNITIWHNPRCSKSRQTLELLRENGHEPEIVEYLKSPPGENEIASVISALEITPRELMRKGEAIYKELDLASQTNDAELIAQMHRNPILIERLL